MIETVPQYMQRILGYAEGQQPLKIQAASAKKLERLLKGMPAAKLRKRPMPDKWSVAEIMAHLADSEIVTSFRLRQILGTPARPSPHMTRTHGPEPAATKNATPAHRSRRSARCAKRTWRC